MATDQSASSSRGGSPCIGSSFLPSFRHTARYSTFKLDEGYSEDTRSQSDKDTVMRADSRAGDMLETDEKTALQNWIISLNGAERGEYIYALLRSLPTSEIAAIVERLNPLLHLDPIAHLPPEITFEIFSYLPAETVLRTSFLSKSWRTRALDSQLWRLLFRLEGWSTDMGRILAFEHEERTRRLALRERKVRARRADADSEQHIHKKRVYESEGEEDRAVVGTSSQGWGEQHGVVEADEGQASSLDDRMLEDKMQDIAFHTPSATRQNTDTMYFPEPKLGFLDDTRMQTSAPLDPPAQTSLLLYSYSENPRINWQYLYKQKRRLEKNWSIGRYTNFSLPHPNFAHEAHTECVYTLQYSGNHLVSGSRDRSVRVWSLETQRLVLPPLIGHSASVLCLQFDPRPEQDVIISGGSDCHVLVWKFSTGELVKKLERAHGESVLNLRFDDDYLITCSKDKTIKVWSRKDLMPTDPAYPKSTKSGARFPQYIINMKDITESQHLNFKPLKAYSLLMTLDGHSAAVNAIQIYDGQVVSASGDRTVKIWDVHTGACIKTLTGHSKGIACVQFDGRRIVSGSSDETVRIFDRATAAEVACLQGHTNLVRTVQASFGDLPGNEEELEAEARAVDKKFFEAHEKGLLNDLKLSREQRRARNAGSRDPRDIFAYGAKLPPGGGGSRWGRIVSGSYDESVIIWKKDPPTGKWVVGRVLLQNEAVRAAGVQRPRRPNQPAVPAPQANAANPQNAQGQGQAPQQAANQPAQNGSGPSQQLQTMHANLQNLTAQAHQQIQQARLLAQQAHALQMQTQAAQAAQQASQQMQHHLAANPEMTSQQQAAHLQQLTQQLQQVQSQAASVQQAHHQTQAQIQSATSQAQATQQQGQAQAQAQQQQPQPQPQQQQQQQPQQQLPHHHHHHHHHHGAAAAGGHGHHPPVVPANQQGGGSRVFKLQFDARRIICCSQDPVIVGWDFAAGDKDIIEASQFFAEEA